LAALALLDARDEIAAGVEREPAAPSSRAASPTT
jgi:hypothetical protein